MILLRELRIALGAALLVAVLATASSAQNTQVLFDLPATIECRDVTPADFAAAHPKLKVIEGKLRISARIAAGSEQQVVDFLYTIESPEYSLRFQDYLPNTTLESAVADDQVEICDASEQAQATGGEARVAYKLFTLGVNHNQTAKKSEASKYKQIAAKELVLASGTTQREHGVFFRLRPSRAASLEGAKEFSFLATVPRTWRGDVCAIACAARASDTSFFSASIAPAGESTALVGLCLVGDSEAAELCRQLREAQLEHTAALAAQAKAATVCATLSHQAVSLLTSKKRQTEAERHAAETAAHLAEVRQRLADFAR